MTDITGQGSWNLLIAIVSRAAAVTRVIGLCFVFFRPRLTSSCYGQVKKVVSRIALEAAEKEAKAPQDSSLPDPTITDDGRGPRTDFTAAAQEQQATG